ncbi:DUF2384 domain-containing protein [Sinorhizobium terangae]|uniref:DUF2384 domain-containing protein n=1 Tax=Sinorhizobium terangae TaxID=110322 RepID=A0A6N7LQ03_SINTE|nr:DUF2384 domain-containing protein [Sinorhizobium terangae]
MHRAAAVVNLLCDDFPGGLEQNVSAAHLRSHSRVAGQAGGADNVDLADIFENDLRDFLFRPHPMLEDKRPIDVVIQSEIGAELVLETLASLKYGSAA